MKPRVYDHSWFLASRRFLNPPKGMFHHLIEGDMLRSGRVVDRREEKQRPANLTAVGSTNSKPLEKAVLVRVPSPT